MVWVFSGPKERECPKGLDFTWARRLVSLLATHQRAAWITKGPLRRPIGWLFGGADS